MKINRIDLIKKVNGLFKAKALARLVKFYTTFSSYFSSSPSDLCKTLKKYIVKKFNLLINIKKNEY